MRKSIGIVYTQLANSLHGETGVSPLYLLNLARPRVHSASYVEKLNVWEDQRSQIQEAMIMNAD
jgi:hypothetical protein